MILTGDQTEFLKLKLDEYVAVGVLSDGYARSILIYEKNKSQFDDVVINIPIEEIGFNVRTLSALQLNNQNTYRVGKKIEKLGDFKGIEISQLRKLKGMGKRCLENITEVLSKYNIVLQD